MSFARIVLHTVWCTKYRDPWIDPVIEPALHDVIGHQFREQGAKPIVIGGSYDHVHALHLLPRTKSMAKVMSAVKANTSRWMSLQHPRYRDFTWQDTYATFSVDYRHTDRLVRYIRNQRDHHTRREPYASYEEEFISLLKAYGFDNYDPKYLFPTRPRRA